MSPEAPIPVPDGAPWLDGWRTLYAQNAGTPLAQAGTVSASGEPEVRTVVLRGVSADGCPYFTTDLRSDKMSSIRAGSEVELCIWWPEPSIQVRLRGPTTPITESRGPWGSVRDDLWTRHRETERRGFAGPPPGAPLDQEQGTAPHETTGAAPNPGHEPPPDRPHPNFGLIVVTPTRFDRLELGDPHVRHVYAWTANTGWDGGRVAP